MFRPAKSRGEGTREEKEDGPRGLCTPIKFFLSARSSPVTLAILCTGTGTRKTATTSTDQAYALCPRSRLTEVGRELGGECDERRQEKERESADILTEDLPSFSDARRPKYLRVCSVRAVDLDPRRENISARGGKSRRGRINGGVCAHALPFSLSLSALLSSPVNSRASRGISWGHGPGDTSRKLACVFSPPWMWT